MEQVSNLVRAAKEPVGELRVAHVDVNIAIAQDGSVGLLGTAGSAKATLTIRLQPDVAQTA
jgi:ABC-type polysaccharide/polyol phosphate transport system ATPase subunit